jgi:hypothetical protein
MPVYAFAKSLVTQLGTIAVEWHNPEKVAQLAPSTVIGKFPYF